MVMDAVDVTKLVTYMTTVVKILRKCAKTTCRSTDDPLFNDRFGQSCEWYNDNPGVCATSMFLQNEEMVDARDSCAVCACDDFPNFKDAYGHGCDWYEPDPKVCEAAHIFKSDVSASQACCVCRNYR